MSGTSTCPGCGGVVGRDCYNPQECAWISRDMAERAHLAAYEQYDRHPCEGCSRITDTTCDCLGLCVGLTCQEDIDARAALWQQIPATFADPATARTPVSALASVTAPLRLDEPPF